MCGRAAARELEARRGVPPLIVAAGAVAFHRVDFRYDPRRPILSDVDFQVASGATVAIVGPSGTGKSTIARLLFRFYDVDAGAVEIDGQAIRNVTQDSLRRAMGVGRRDQAAFNGPTYRDL